MTQINLKTAPQNLPLKYQVANPGMDFDSVKNIQGINEDRPSYVREPDFAELHAMFETQYEQFLTDTSDEIAKGTRRLSELESIFFGNPPPAKLHTRN